MNLQLHPKALLALALCAAWGSAQATETVVHNDMDGDGRSDMIWRNAGSGAIVYWSGADASRPGTVRIDQLGRNMPAGFDLRRMRVVLGYDGDWLDGRHAALVVRDPGTGATYNISRHGGGSGYLALDLIGDADWKVVGAGDFNGYGSGDLLYRNRRNGSNRLVTEAGWYAWASIVPVAAVTNLAWQVAGVGDFDGDRRSDILWRNAATGQNAIWRSGNAATRLGVATVANLGWKVTTVGDFNGDGRSDILWRNTRTGANAIWKSGNNLTPQAVASVTDQRWQVAATGDFNGDGKWDLVWRNAGTGANVLWKSADRGSRLTLPTTALAWSAVM